MQKKHTVNVLGKGNSVLTKRMMTDTMRAFNIVTSGRKSLMTDMMQNKNTKKVEIKKPISVGKRHLTKTNVKLTVPTISK